MTFGDSGNLLYFGRISGMPTVNVIPNATQYYNLIDPTTLASLKDSDVVYLRGYFNFIQNGLVPIAELEILLNRTPDVINTDTFRLYSDFAPLKEYWGVSFGTEDSRVLFDGFKMSKLDTLQIRTVGGPINNLQRYVPTFRFDVYVATSGG